MTPERINGQRCYACKEVKPLDAFSADRTRPNGRMSRCKKCNYTRVAAYARSERGRHKHRQYQLHRTYGLTPEQYEAQLEAQGHVCAICGTHPERVLAVDHDHMTGKVRGLLCRRCNSAIGLMDDNAEKAQAAADYLARHT